MLDAVRLGRRVFWAQRVTVKLMPSKEHHATLSFFFWFWCPVCASLHTKTALLLRYFIHYQMPHWINYHSCTSVVWFIHTASIVCPLWLCNTGILRWYPCMIKSRASRLSAGNSNNTVTVKQTLLKAMHDIRIYHVFVTSMNCELKWKRVDHPFIEKGIRTQG